MSIAGETEPERPAPYWKCVVAALPPLFVAWQYVAALRAGRGARGDTSWLTSGMQAEFLAIHSMAFLGMIALWKPKTPKEAQTRALVFWGLFGAYLLGAWHAGTQLAALFAGATFVTYLGLFLNWRSESAQVQLGARWLAGFVLFVAALQIFGAPRRANDWVGQTSVLRAGALYFLGLAALELSGFYLRWLPPRAGRIAAALRQSRRVS
ncbi:MAG TPA: hypothetical protein VG873_03455 [Burkholderiales bacterium]|nr:hypothetical protein [Burkholderiales bacterium]